MSRDGSHYTRATGRLSKAPYGIYADSGKVHRPTSTIYSVEESGEADKQYPLGCITTTQRTLVSNFLCGLCDTISVDIDDNHRCIHSVGVWRCSDPGITISCTAVQPHVTNATVHIRGVTNLVVTNSRQDYNAVVGGREPSLNTITGYPQPQGAMAVPFTDYMIARGTLSGPRCSVQWSNTVLSKTQLVFIVVTSSSAYECVLTHASCAIMAREPPRDAIVLPPSSNSESYTFRRLSLTHGQGSGPSVTVHRSGTMQYQGGGDYVKSLMSNFRNCINHTMSSRLSTSFVESLGIVRDVSSFMPKV